MIQAIAQATFETIKAAIMAVREADNPVNNASSVHVVPIPGGPAVNNPHLTGKQQTNIRN